MAINRYDSPAQDRYTNTYVPLPYEAIMGTVAARQAQMQREQDMLNKTYEDTQNLKYIPGTKDEGYVRDYVSKASDLVNKYYGQDLSDPIVKQQLRREFSNITDKQTIQNIQSSHAAWATNQKYKAELKAQGLYDPAIDEDPANADFDTRQGVYNYIAPSYKNPRQAAEQYFNNIKATDLGASGDYMYSGVTRDKINEVANAKWGEFVNTSEGNLYVKKIAKERGLDYTDQNVRRQIGTEYLQGVGEEFTYRDRGAATLDAQVRAARGKKDEEDKSRTNTTRSQNIRTTDDFDPFKVGKVNFDKDGNVLMSTASKEHLTVVPGLGPGKPSSEYVDEVKKSELQAEVKQKLDLIRTKLPQLKGLSDQEVYKAYKDITLDGKAFGDLPKIELPEVARKGYAADIASSLLDRTVQVMDEFGVTDARKTTDTEQGSPLEDLGYTTSSLKKAIEDGDVTVGGLAQNGEAAGMIQLEVPDKSRKGGSKGKVRKLYVSGSREMAEIMAPANDVYNVIRNFEGGVVPIGKDAQGTPVAVQVTPNIQKDPTTGKWVYDYQLNEGTINPDGSFNQGGAVDINDLRALALKRLTESGYLNSEVSFTKENINPGF